MSTFKNTYVFCVNYWSQFHYFLISQCNRKFPVLEAFFPHLFLYPVSTNWAPPTSLALDTGSDKATTSNWALPHSAAEIQHALTSVRLRGLTFAVRALRVVKFLTVHNTLVNNAEHFTFPSALCLRENDKLGTRHSAAKLNSIFLHTYPDIPSASAHFNVVGITAVSVYCE
jgi:hypothetical protein